MSSILLFIGGSEMVFIILAGILLFGVNRIPEIARTLGKGIAEFKNATNDIKRELNDAANSIDITKNTDNISTKKNSQEPKIDDTSKGDK